jgi:rod shape-determining protein MreD
MRIVVHAICSFLLTVLLGALWRLTPFEMVVPNLPLLYALFLGASSRNPIWEATAAAIVIGYLADVVAGAPRGLGALVLGTICILTRLVSIRLLFRGWLLVAGLSFVAAAAAGLLTLGLCALAGAGVGPLPRELFIVGGSALATAFFSPLVFKLCRVVDARFARTQRERDAVREGYLL